MIKPKRRRRSERSERSERSKRRKMGRSGGGAHLSLRVVCTQAFGERGGGLRGVKLETGDLEGERREGMREGDKWDRK